MILRLWPTLTLILAALSLGPSFAHVLEAPPRLKAWPQQLWIDTTVHHGQFTLFRSVGAPLDLLAILAAAVLAVLLRGEPGFKWVLAGAVLLALGLAAWSALVAPANSILATWRTGSPPTDFQAIRQRWESGHMAVALLKLLAFVALALGATAFRSAR